MAAKLLLLLLCLQSTGCGKSPHDASEVLFACEVEPQPARVGSNTFTVTLKSRAGAPLGGARVALEGDMAHPGMSPVFGEAKETVPGVYRGTIDLSMLGDWVVLFHVTLASGQTMERQISLASIRAN